jgi:hypothetical protein
MANMNQNNKRHQNTKKPQLQQGGGTIGGKITIKRVETPEN